jgi:RNA 2',3'-cyclic 3'-phosphodiesterase
MRLFIAITIPDDVRNALAQFIEELRGVAPDAKWVRAENLHVTLKFLGETDPAKLPAIQKQLASINHMEPVSFSFHGLGFFPNPRYPRVFWVGMETSVNLILLAENIDEEMNEIGFPLDKRAFTPHLTLARLDPPGMPAQLAAAAKENEERRFGSLTTNEFHLIESKLKPTGAEYTTIQTVPFAAGT